MKLLYSKWASVNKADFANTFIGIKGAVMQV